MDANGRGSVQVTHSDDSVGSARWQPPPARALTGS
jgi:hypothetical protein